MGTWLPETCREIKKIERQVGYLQGSWRTALRKHVTCTYKFCHQMSVNVQEALVKDKQTKRSIGIPINALT